MGSFQLLVKSVLLLLLVFLCMFKNSIATSSDDIKSFSNELTRKSHDAWIKSHDIALVYYHHRDRESNISESDSREIVRLIDVLERSANNLNKHGIHFAVAICEEISSTERCSSKKDPKDVAVYRHGVYMTELAPGVLFDEDAVISNCLELLLRDKVPLLQKPDQLRDHMTASIQKSSHFLFMIVHGIGAKEHSHLLQIAHHHTGSLTFAHSTSQNILDEFEINAQSSSAAKDLDLDNSQVRLLYFNCGKGSVAGKGACDIHHYLGSFKMAPLQVYMDMLEAPAGIPSEEAYKRKLPVTVCYYVDQSSKEKAEALTNQMSEEMKGSMLFYASNSESVRAGLKLNQSDTLCSIKAAEQHLAFSDYSRVRDDVLKLISRKPNEFKTSEDIEADALDELIEKVETRDDSVDLADQALGARKNLSLSHLVQLDRNTFMYEKFSGIVLFHIKKYDYMSRVALRLFDAAAARQAEVKYHSLDCYDWTDVCRKIGVSSFPTVRVYHEGDYSEYAGPTSVEGFTRLGFLSQFTAPLRVPSMAAMTRLNQTLEMSHFISGSIVLGLFKDDLSQEFKAFEEAAKTLIGQKLMVAAFDKLAERLIQKYRLPSLPALISLDLAESNPAKANKPFNKKVFCSPNMKNFALRSSLPSFAELTPSTLPVVSRSQKLQVILFTDRKSADLFTRVEELSMDSDLLQTFEFNYILVADNEMNQRILETLTGDFAAVTPALLVVNYKQGAVFIYSDGGKKVDAQLIKEWLGSVSAGSTPVTKHLAKGEWKPMHPGYDFLAMKEADKKRYVPERTRFDISPRQDMMSPQDTPLALNVGTEKVAASVDRPLHTEL